MPFGLVINSDKANALQSAVEAELVTREFTTEADPVMAEYITIMLINNKTSEQITSELKDLIGDEFGEQYFMMIQHPRPNFAPKDPSFTDWLFVEAQKGAADSTIPTAPAVKTQAAPATASPSSTNPPESSRNGIRSNPIYNRAIDQALPSSGQKRTASARSPSPNGSSAKSRRLDGAPTGPRNPGRGRSLMDRVGGRNAHPNDEVQNRIDSVTRGAGNNMGQAYPAMDLSTMQSSVGLQDMMMAQMALMAQMASITGMMPPGFPQQQGHPDQFNNNNNLQGGRGRGGGSGRGRGGHQGRGGGPFNGHGQLPIASPTPLQATAAPFVPGASQQSTPSYAIPERPLSPSLCKYGPKCTNAQCRWSHPSPVSTIESGIVLSSEPCEKGKDCQDKDCTFSHVSPAVLKPEAIAQAAKAQPNPPAPVAIVAPTPVTPTPNTVPCKFGLNCTNPSCQYVHPARAAPVPCRFGASCTRPGCTFSHPAGRSFNRTLGGTPARPADPTIAGAMNKSVKFNSAPSSESAGELQRKLNELEEMKKKLAAQEAASSPKKDGSSSTSVAAA